MPYDTKLVRIRTSRNFDKVSLSLLASIGTGSHLVNGRLSLTLRFRNGFSRYGQTRGKQWKYTAQRPSSYRRISLKMRTHVLIHSGAVGQSN
jgi:hypothetical protein